MVRICSQNYMVDVIRILNNGHVTIHGSAENRVQMRPMWPQSKLHCNFGDIKIHCAAAQVRSTGFSLKSWP